MQGRILYHSIVKSIRGRVIFYKDSDRLLFLNILRRFIDKHSVTIVEFVIMDNHVHLLHTADSKEHAMLFLSEMQQNFVFWYNRFHSSHDKLLIPAKIYPKYTEEAIIRCSLYILQNPMVAYRKDYPHPKDFKWSSYHYHYDYMSKAPRLVPNSTDVIRANKIFDIINCSKSIHTNKCPLLRAGFIWPILKLQDLLPVSTHDLDALYTKTEFKILVQKSVISPKEEYSSDSAMPVPPDKPRNYKGKGALAALSEFLQILLAGRNYTQLEKSQKEELIFQMFKCTRTTQKQLVMLLDEDKENIKNLFLKYKYQNSF